jgi:hypothetical protein
MVRVFNTILYNFIQYFCEICMNGLEMTKLGRKMLPQYSISRTWLLIRITCVSRVWSYSNCLVQLTHRDDKHKNAAVRDDKHKNAVFCLLGVDRRFTFPNPLSTDPTKDVLYSFGWCETVRTPLCRSHICFGFWEGGVTKTRENQARTCVLELHRLHFSKLIY